MFTIWLIPDLEQEVLLRATIERFARMSGSDPFVPHVTLLSGFQSVEDAERAISRIQGAPPFELPVRGVSSSDEIFRAVVIDLEATRELVSLRSFVANHRDESEPSIYAPHLSLAYGALSENLRAQLVEEARSNLPDSIRIARLDVTRTRGQVGDWETLTQHRLKD